MKKYEKPKIRIAKFELADILTVSTVEVDGGSTDFHSSWIDNDVDGQVADFLESWKVEIN